MKPIVFFGTPHSGRKVTADFAVSLASATAHLAERGIKSIISAQGGHDVASQRDYLASTFLSTGATHFQLVDSDIAFPEDLPFILLQSQKSLVGALCPRRAIDTQLLERFIREGRSGVDALRLAHQFAVDFGEYPNFTGLGEVRRIGAGFMMVERSVFEKIISAGDAPEYKLHNTAKPLRAFFPWTEIDGERRPEDFAFCDKWRDLGGQVFAYTAATMAHVAPYRHETSFSDLMAAITGR